MFLTSSGPKQSYEEMFMKVCSDLSPPVLRLWWNRSTPCNPQQPRKTKARIFTSRPSTYPLARTVSCAYPLHHRLIWPLTSVQLWSIPHTCIWETLWNHRPQWRRKVNSPPAYRHARGSYSLTHHHPFRRARSAIHLTSILLQHVYIMNM